MFSCIFDLFYPLSSKPTLDLFLTYFNVFGVSGPLGRLLLHKSCNPLHDKKTTNVQIIFRSCNFLFAGRILAKIKLHETKHLRIFFPVM